MAGGLTLSDTSFIVPALSQIAPDGTPPASAFPTTLLVSGVDVAHPSLGPFASAKLVAGRGFTDADRGADVAVVDSAYAAAHSLAVGGSVTVELHRFTIIGLAAQPAGSADVSIPLARAQALAKASSTSPYTGMTSPDMVTDIYVRAAGASDVAGVRSGLARLLPAATVSSASSLADQVSGSLKDVSRLINQLGRWLSAGVLTAAFVLASLLTLAAVSSRRRELGTLRALGWPRRLVVGQITAEALVTGAVGAVFGVAIGLGGAAVLSAIAPKLTATVANSPGNVAPKNVGINATGMHVTDAPGSLHDLAVRMAAPVSASLLLVAVATALAGGLVAGLVGSWRASRLPPAAAMSDVG
ncbi:ABC transporter permease [Catenulispora yoronensis]